MFIRNEEFCISVSFTMKITSWLLYFEKQIETYIRQNAISNKQINRYVRQVNTEIACLRGSGSTVVY